MIIQNIEMAGFPVKAPDGTPITLDAQGFAEVPDDCGIEAVPGFVVKSGTPTAVVQGNGVLIKPAGPLVEIFGPAWAADQTINAPDGLSKITFDANARGVGPTTSRMNEIPEFSFGALIEPEPAPQQAAPVVAPPAAPQAAAPAETAPVAEPPAPQAPVVAEDVADDKRGRGRPRGTGKAAALAAAEAATE